MVSSAEGSNHVYVFRAVINQTLLINHSPVLL